MKDNLENKLEQKIKNLKDFIKLKTDQGVANYVGKEIRDICGMVEDIERESHERDDQDTNDNMNHIFPH